MPVTLENRIRRMQVFHLPHELCCRDHCTCAALTAVTTIEHPRTGERARRAHQKAVPGSITFLANERKVGLPSALLEVPEVKAAIDRRDLRIIEQTPDDSAVAAPSGVPTSPAAAPPAAAPPTLPPAAAPPTVAMLASTENEASRLVPGSPAIAKKELS